jgi:hypothetical protein
VLDKERHMVMSEIEESDLRNSKNGLQQKEGELIFSLKQTFMEL